MKDYLRNYIYNPKVWKTFVGVARNSHRKCRFRGGWSPKKSLMPTCPRVLLSSTESGLPATRTNGQSVEEAMLQDLPA